MRRNGSGARCLSRVTSGSGHEPELTGRVFALHALTGYCDAWSVRPGGRIGFMVSSAADAAFDLRFVRHICADPNPAGPGYTEIAMPTGLDGPQPGHFQPARPGSFARATGLPDDLSELSVSVSAWPTTPGRGEQALICLTGAGWTLTVGLDPTGAAFVEAEGMLSGRATVAAPMLGRRWYDVTAGHEGGRLWVRQQPSRPVGHIAESGAAETALPAASRSGSFDVTLAAHATRTAPYNGKLERPTIRRAERIVACWDFARNIGGSTAIDTGPHAAHATLVNLPTQAMTGVSWTGAVHDWTRAPEQYGAIHFHDDDVGDLGWAESFALDVPSGWPSGFYAAHIRHAAGEDMIPFFVAPARPAADVVVLVPTYTYQVYGCHVREGRGAEIAARAREWNALSETPDMNPQFGLSTYNNHADGSGVSLVSQRRPMLDNRPRQFVMLDEGAPASGTSRICSDSYIVHWLTTLGIAHDVVTDHDLHEQGVGLLSPYRVVIAAQHPEYHSERMMEALETYLAEGGRMMYLGGNGFYWRAEPSLAEPHALEVRRAENGVRVWATEPGENYHAFGGGFAGLWRRIGRPAHRLVGNGFSAQGRQIGFPYRFTDAIADPRVAFMLVDLEVRPGEAFGDRGFMGNGAVGFELDSVDPAHGTPPNTLVVAKGVVIHPDYYPVNEDRLATRLPKRTEDWSCADMLFFETAPGGAVFSVGSMTFVGSLAVDSYDNVLARLTGNVIRRFLDPAPFD